MVLRLPISVAGVYKMPISFTLYTFGVLLICSVSVIAEEEEDAGKGRAFDLPVARSMLADIARELIARSGTNSQVLSLNLTNLIILLVLKGLLLGAAMLGTGAWKSRSLQDGIADYIPKPGPLLTEAELLLLISYLMGETNSKYDCLLRVSCQEPKKAREYVAAGKLLIKGAKIFNKAVPLNPKYETLVEELQQAIEYGNNGGICEQKYSCSGHNSVKK